MKTNWKKVPHENWEHMREMRKQPSPIEQRLWRTLRRHSTGAHFRRQHPVGPYIVDFCAPRHSLVLEIDGDSHAGDEAERRDEQRTRYLEEQGFRILRFANREVYHNLDGVLRAIWEAVNP